MYLGMEMLAENESGRYPKLPVLAVACGIYQYHKPSFLGHRGR